MEEGREGSEPLRYAQGAPAAPWTRRDALLRAPPAGHRRLEIGEKIEAGDHVWPAQCREPNLQDPTAVGCEVESEDLGYYYRPIPAPQDGVPRTEGEGVQSLPCWCYGVGNPPECPAHPGVPEPSLGEGANDDLIKELVEALREIAEAEDSMCRRCEGECRVWADGQAHHQGYNGPLMACPDCGGTGKQDMVDLRAIAKAALSKAEAP